MSDQISEAVAKAQARLAEERLEAARHVLWHIGDPRGQEPGSFTSKLLDAWTRADHENSARLTLAFPILGDAIEEAKIFGADAVATWGGIE